MNAGLLVTSLAAGYGNRPVLNGAALPLAPPGTVTALIGPNGAGKSTMLKALAGLLPARGKALLDGTDILTLDPVARARLVAFMPQALPGDTCLSVLDSVIAALIVSQPALPVREARKCAVATLERLGMLHLALSALDRLSGGQKQMAGLAQAIVTDPRLLLLDEPVSALDLRHQFHVMRTVRSLATEGRIVVVVLHDLSLASRWADLLVVLHEGAIHSAGTPDEVVTPPMLRAVYGVEAQVTDGLQGALQISINDTVSMEAS